ncbi:MAG: hypothetical protein ABMB14_13445 [Myxococcota bacterium]
MRTLAGLTLVGVATYAGGCTCNAQEYAFPKAQVEEFEDPPAHLGRWLSFDAAPDGLRLTMSYYDEDRGALGYAVGAPNEDGTVAWLHERVDGYPNDAGLDLADVGRYSSQKTAPDGTVWIAYQEPSKGGLKIAHRAGPNTWDAPATVDGGSGAPGVGHWASLALDAAGLPVVAHVDQGAAAVRVSRYDGAAWSTTQVYVSKPIDAVDPYGVVTTTPAGVANTALVIHGSDEWLAVYDAAETSLHLLHGTGGAFTDEIVDDAGDVGAWPSVWTDGDAVWIAYQDVGEQDLKFASREGDGPWAIERIDLGELRGADGAVYADGGEPRIVYDDAYDNDLWLASRAGGAWTTAKLGGDEGAIGFHNEVAYAAGRWWAGSYDYTAHGLFVKPL